MNNKPKSYVGLKAENMGFDAHLTLIYCGELDPFKEDYVRRVLKFWTGPRSFECSPYSFDMFGPDRNIPVIKVEVTPRLLVLRKMLKNYWIPDTSEYSWNPHITLQLPKVKKVKIPPKIQLNQLNLY